jgi:hypothetical protein
MTQTTAGGRSQLLAVCNGRLFDKQSSVAAVPFVVQLLAQFL